MPRVVINEYYAQRDNDPNDLTLVPATKTYTANNYYRVNIWAELANVFPTESASADPQQGAALLYNTQGGYAIYQLVVCQQAALANFASRRSAISNIRNANNFAGVPNIWIANPASNPPTQPLPPLATPPMTPPYNTPTTSYPQISSLSSWGTNTPQGLAKPPNTIAPGFGSYKDATQSNQGFYVVGPTLPTAPAAVTTALAGSVTNLPTIYTDPALSFPIPQGSDPTTPGSNFQPALLLQRLANPYLPPNYSTANPLTYNPYITIDYVARVNVNDGRIFSTAGMIPAGTLPAMTARPAWGKLQPFASYYPASGVGANGQWVAQAPNPPPVNQPLNTFYRHNGVESNPPPASPNKTLTVPFDVQYHPDRVPISLGDLLHVSSFKPHEFTQQFVDGNGTKFMHRAPWTDQSSHINRLWELLTISGRTNGPARGGRIPGKININGIWDQTVLQALCDAQGANQFTSAQVGAIWSALLTNRSPDQDPTTKSNMPGGNSLPFWAMGMGYTTTNDLIMVNSATPTPALRDINTTLLRPSTNSIVTDTNQLRMLEPTNATVQPSPPNTSPTEMIQRYELLSKILGNTTTRSNVFAVWVTFGFFKVTNPNTRPIQFGAEYVWPSSQAPIRHKYFAIIDRSQLQVWPTYDNTNQPVAQFGGNGVASISVTATTGSPTFTPLTPINLMDKYGNALTTITNPNTNQTWTLQAGSVLTFDPGMPVSVDQNTKIRTGEETVVVQNDPTSGKLSARFYNSHTAGGKNAGSVNSGAIVISRGNPGPWTQYDPTQDPYVVPYAAKIN